MNLFIEEIAFTKSFGEKIGKFSPGQNGYMQSLENWRSRSGKF